MPFPNSQSPVTQRFNELFANPSTIPDFDGQTTAVEALRNFAIDAGDIAAEYGAAPNQAAVDHVNSWPVGQQKLVRRTLADAIEQERPVTFDWQTAIQTRVDIIDFGTGPIGITFRSPLQYPPYTGS